MTPSEPNGMTGAGTVDRLAAQQGESMSPGSPSRRPRGAGAPGEPIAPEQEAVKVWIRAHEELALFGAFAVGVFIGALMRS